MYKVFKLEPIKQSKGQFYYNIGKEILENQKVLVKKTLNDFILMDDKLDGSKIIETWFPQINAHIFISHSHKDEDSVIVLAGWLYKNFGLISFVDSCIWGYGNDLIKHLDNKFNRLSHLEELYDYNKCLISSSHVHMMLSTAINMMINKTECLFFYNTQNAIISFDGNEKTDSPWIYSEIAFSKIAEIKRPSRIDLIKKSLNGDEHLYATGDPNLEILYDANSMYQTINEVTLNLWYLLYDGANPEDALDKLYEIVN